MDAPVVGVLTQERDEIGVQPLQLVERHAGQQGTLVVALGLRSGGGEPEELAIVLSGFCLVHAADCCDPSRLRRTT
ncbi:MAG TPA: hypothetical protein VFG42_03630 [Baekduia sp.]|uniref:hypothetical protein n=1 Tax=Baekduia sp. TaxID=2600305 RepID=UPI002D77C1CA|nr:hypothetical protein [Baekduia sp.]HET6505855.1 hypothetical protein [Baekduia sp.]